MIRPHLLFLSFYICLYRRCRVHIVQHKFSYGCIIRWWASGLKHIEQSSLFLCVAKCLSTGGLEMTADLPDSVHSRLSLWIFPKVFCKPINTFRTSLYPGSIATALNRKPSWNSMQCFLREGVVAAEVSHTLTQSKHFKKKKKKGYENSVSIHYGPFLYNKHETITPGLLVSW